MKFELTRPMVICALSAALVGLVWTMDPVGAYLVITLAAVLRARLNWKN